MDQREKDIQKLCSAVITAAPNERYNSGGADTATCPFCHKQWEGVLNGLSIDMSDIVHSPTCAYHIAKDLSTGYVISS